MNKVITINLNGNAFPLEENGYEALRSYLDTAGRRLEGNPDKDEIIADIEQAIADKFRAVLGAYKTVVVTKEVENVISEMGPVQAPSAEADGPAPAEGGARPANEPLRPEGAPLPKRLHKIRDGAMIGGVCNGLAAYTGIDVTIIRIVFAMLAIVYGTGVLLYVLMMIIFPEASTPAQKAAATGMPFTAQEFIRRAKEGYYEGMRTFSDKRAHREWKRNFKREMRGWKRDFQQEMRGNVHQWGRNWHRYWSQPPPRGIGASIVLPILCLVNTLLGVVGACAVISLVCTGLVFGFTLPFSAPLWVGILFLIVVYKIVAWPLKAARHAYYFGGAYGHSALPHFLEMLQALVWFAFWIFIFWAACHHRGQVHETLRHLPQHLRHAVDSIRQWWNAQ